MVTLTGAHFQFLNDWLDAVIIELIWCIAVGYVHENGTAEFGHDLPVSQPVCLSFKRLLHSESRPMVDTGFSAKAAVQPPFARRLI